MSVAIIILASGTGTRANSNIPKQFIKVNGKTSVRHVIDLCKTIPGASVILAVSPDIKDKYPGFQEEDYKDIYQVAFIGGDTRTETVRNCIDHLVMLSFDCVVFLDAARPFLSRDFILECIDLISNDKADGVITFTPMTDGLATNELVPVDRSLYLNIQTPECFNVQTLLEVYAQVDPVRELPIIGSPLVEAGKRIIQKRADWFNFKITYSDDIYIAESLMWLHNAKQSAPTNSDLADMNILVLGSFGGIGQAIKKELIANNAIVYELNRKDADLAAKTITFPEWVYKIRWNTIIHSAGICPLDSEGLLEKFDDTMNVNIKSVLSIIELSKETMSGGGNIVVLGSAAGIYGRAGISLYAASKAALNSIVQSQAVSLARYGIRINSICPGKVPTKMLEKISPGYSSADSISAEYVAKRIIEYCNTTATGNIVYLKKGFDK